MAENFPRLITETKPQVQEAQKNCKQDKYAKPTSKYIQIFGFVRRKKNITLQINKEKHYRKLLIRNDVCKRVG